MKPQRWDRIRQVFEQALDQTHENRTIWLNEVCEGDEVLQSEVQALLAASEISSGVLERPVGDGLPMLYPQLREALLPPGIPRDLAEESTQSTTSGDAGVWFSDPVGRFVAGSVIADRFRMIAFLGRGGMGEVYRAEDLLLDVPVALKFLNGALAEEGSPRNLLDEIRLARQVTHQYVCRVYDLVEAAEGIFLSMELVDGDDLASILSRLGPLSQEKTLQMARQLARGLAAIHRQEILHLDLKPSNLMIDRRGALKIMDFGIAAFVKDHSSIPRGTPSYMSPEQLSGAKVTKKSDLYAFGLVVYELQTGVRATRTEDDGGFVPPSHYRPDIDPEIERILLSCLASDPDQRPESAEEIEKALASRADGDEASGAEAWHPEAGATLPQRPHWTLERRLSEGGFGDVWLATHDKTRETRVFKFGDEHRHLQSLKREVTIYRLLKESLGDRADISRILDWNFDQTPYFLEAAFTDGGSFSAWTEAQGGLAEIPRADRLEMIAQVATALGAAHSVGVLHQDVKPGNILISTGPEGQIQACLSDFGIGEVLIRERLQAIGITALGFTESSRDSGGSSWQGTRLYMAPELLEGKPATVQADLYALGVLLYQVVTGDLSRALGPGWEHDIDDELLREDIARLVDRAPERRTTDAQSVADRLRSLRERHEALLQRRREAREAEEARAALLVVRRRRRLAAMAFLVLAAFAAMTTVQSHRIRQEAETAEQISGFLIDLFRVSAPATEARGDVKARELLDAGAERIEQSLPEQPAVRARLMLIMGEVYRELGLYSDAVSLVEKSLATRRTLYGDKHSDFTESLVALAEVYHERGDSEKAIQLGREALELNRQLFSGDSSATAKNLEVLGHAYAASSQSEAEQFFREALEIRTSLKSTDPAELAKSYGYLGRILRLSGQNDEAKDLLRKAVDIQLSLNAPDYVSTVSNLNQLGLMYQYQGEFDSAEQFFRQALKLRRGTYDKDLPCQGAGSNYLAFLLEMRGDLIQAEELYRKEWDIFREQLGDHRNSKIAIGNLARTLQSLDRYDEAEELLLEGLAMRRRLYGEDSISVGYSTSILGLLYVATGEKKKASEALDQIDRVLSESIGKENSFAGLTYLQSSLILSVLGREAEAEVSLDEAIRILEEAYSDKHYWTIHAKVSKVDQLLKQGKVDEAEALTRGIWDKVFLGLPESEWRVQVARSVRGALLARRGDFEQAEVLLTSSYEAIRAQKGRKSLYTQQARERLADLYRAWGKDAKAAGITAAS